MDPFEYCIQCNPAKNWLELEFRSENDEPINGLDVKITLDTTGHTYTAKTYDGHVVFGRIPAGQYRVTVSQTTLLTEVEKYASRKEGVDSPVKPRAESEEDGSGNAKKKYKLVTIGDFWDEAPVDDDFLIEHHNGIDINASDEKAGFCLNHNRTYVFEVKALRSYLPYIVDTDDFSLVNSYTFALLARLAYAKEDANLDDDSTVSSEGAIAHITKQLKSRQIPTYTADIKANWLVKEVPYSQALSTQYYAYKDVGAEGYLLYNDDIVVLGVRGTEPYVNNGKATPYESMWEVVKEIDGIGAIVTCLPAAQEITDSSLVKDLFETDMDAAQIPVELFGRTYVHQGFYRYTMTLWNGNEELSLETDIYKHHQNKKFYVCGHSLGGASATIASALLKENKYSSKIRLYTYGSPRTGTRSFVERYQSIVHYRHVNDDDLVPQVPMKWVNTADQKDSKYLYILKKYGMAGGLFEAATEIDDQDDDNYHHHGRLTQLLTYQMPNRQVLLTPKQTHIPMFGTIKEMDKDSYDLLVDIESNTSIRQQVDEHGMASYIPNIKELLYLLTSKSLKGHYEQVISELQEKQRKLEITNRSTKMEKAGMAGDWHYNDVSTAKYYHLTKQIRINESMLEAYQRVLSRLIEIKNEPESRTSKEILVGGQMLPESLKEQICSILD
ncbi:lipase [Vibrio parahaemolyticus]|nr:lipase [Vibrio parahaemolyticus]